MPFQQATRFSRRYRAKSETPMSQMSFRSNSRIAVLTHVVQWRHLRILLFAVILFVQSTLQYVVAVPVSLRKKLRRQAMP